MTLRLLFFILGTCALTNVAGAARAPVEAKVEQKAVAKSIDPAAPAGLGWINLVQDSELADWLRVPLPPGRPPDSRSPWSYDASSGILTCDGTGHEEMFLHRTPRGDGVFRVEWRFPGSPAKPNAGILVRTKSDKSAWFEADLSAGGVGTLIGMTASRGGKPLRFTSGAKRPGLLRKGDEWNVAEITCLGTRLTLSINGVAVPGWTECIVSEAMVGIRAEGSMIELRGVLFKPVP